ncbi:MAG: D-alanyl-D-alanine carboxypeptidase [Alphaproteobacteria bacterium]|nr:D-alanyl-D-alanine carboxypeptidase [Alphaproteobacteria bacterium]
MISLRPTVKAALFTIGLVALASLPARAQNFGIETEAREAILVDATTGTVLLAKDADKPMPPSSMSKIMTVFMVFEKLRRGELKLTDEFTVSENAWRRGGAASGGSTMFLPVNSRAKLEDLLRGIIVQSGNDACIVIAEGLAGSEERFAEQMTARARELGLRTSVFKNSTGLPDPEHMMTARELAVLAKIMIETFPEYYRYYSETSFTYNNTRQGNRNPLLYKNMGADGLKTGHTEAAGYGLTASAKRGDRRLILVVNGLKSMNQRSREAERLMEWGFREYENVALFKQGQKVDDVDVWMGQVPKVAVVAERDIVFTLPQGSRRDTKVVLTYDGPVPAPIRQGTPIARLTVTGSGIGEPVEIPLVAGTDVDRLGPFGRIAAAVTHLIFGALKK